MKISKWLIFNDIQIFCVNYSYNFFTTDSNTPELPLLLCFTFLLLQKYCSTSKFLPSSSMLRNIKTKKISKNRNLSLLSICVLRWRCCPIYITYTYFLIFGSLQITQLKFISHNIFLFQRSTFSFHLFFLKNWSKALYITVLGWFDNCMLCFD